MLEERFNSLGRFLKNTFGERVNRMNIFIPGDPKSHEGGKEYSLCPGGPCETEAPQETTLPVQEQITRAKERIRQKFKYGKYIVHFHTYANTTITLDTLRKAIEKTMQDDEIIGINVTARVDSLDDNLIKFLNNVSQHIYLWVETGLISIHDATLQRLGLPFNVQDALTTINKLLRKDLRVSTHVVLGLPGETSDMMKQTMEEVSRLMVNGVNIQHFLFGQNTPYTEALTKGEITLLPRADYIAKVCDFIEILPPNIILRRLISESAYNPVWPEWTTDKKKMLSEISDELEKRNSYQGCKNLSYIGIAKVFGESDAETDQAEQINQAPAVEMATFTDEDE